MVPTQMPYARVELDVPQEARILAIADLEIRGVSGRRHGWTARGLEPTGNPCTEMSIAVVSFIALRLK